MYLNLIFNVLKIYMILLFVGCFKKRKFWNRKNYFIIIELGFWEFIIGFLFLLYMRLFLMAVMLMLYRIMMVVLLFGVKSFISMFVFFIGNVMVSWNWMWLFIFIFVVLLYGYFFLRLNVMFLIMFDRV